MTQKKLNIPLLLFPKLERVSFRDQLHLCWPNFFPLPNRRRKKKKRRRKSKRKGNKGAERARKLGTGSREDERRLVKARQDMIYISFQSFALKMVNALNDGINNCIQRTAGIDLKTPVRGTPVEYPCNDLVRHSSGWREIVCE